jgi:glycosyltransferase involved in cell wall biosynthesis
MVLIEAMACGKPVVASDSPGVRSVVSDGADGRLAQRGDAAGLAAALRSLLAEPALRRAMGQRGRAKVEAKYAWERIGEQLDGLYANVVASTTPEAANAV